MSKSELKRNSMIGLIASVVASLAIFASANLAAAQQDEKIRRIGFLSIFSQSHSGSIRYHKAFQRGLRELGWVAGKNIDITYRWMDRRRERLPALADELLGLKVEIIVVHGGHAARIVQRKSKTIPIVMAEASDAVGRGIVQSLAQPGGNITGLTSITPVLVAKRLELLKEIVPGLARVGVIWTKKSPASRYAWKVIQRPAQQLGLQLHSTELRSPNDLAKAFDDAVRAGAGALIDTSGTHTFGSKRIVGLAVKSGLPAIFLSAGRVINLGGLMSYNRDAADLYRRAAAYVDKILKGAKPADLPVEQPTKFDLVVNLKTANALGITLPPSILLRATEVIE